MENDSKSVLIVDDSIFMRASLIELIKKENLISTVYEASDGVEAVQMYKKFKPSLVTMDLDMPKANGMQALRAIKKIEKNARVILVTANKKRDVQNEAFKNEVHGIVTKPIDKTSFIWMIKEALRR